MRDRPIHSPLWHRGQGCLRCSVSSSDMVNQLFFENGSIKWAVCFCMIIEQATSTSCCVVALYLCHWFAAQFLAGNQLCTSSNAEFTGCHWFVVSTSTTFWREIMCIPVPMQTYDVTISVLRQHPHKTAISGLSRKEASVQHSPGALPSSLINHKH